MKNQDPIEQHDLPKTYLKRFSIDPYNSKYKNMIYCYWKDEYGVRTKFVSVNSQKFKKSNFYTIDHKEEPYIFEKTFSKKIEPIYNAIMTEIEEENDLSLECRQNLIVWLYINKYRNKANRDKTEEIINFIIKTTYSMKHGKEKYDRIKNNTEAYSKGKSKEFQLDALISNSLIEDFEKGIGTKHWIILKSRSKNRFLTNDNPGFSININMGDADMNSLNNFYATNGNASNYFVLSPYYCLLISPFWTGTPLDISIHNQTIEFKVTNEKHIDFINYCTKITRTKYLLSQFCHQI